MLVLVAVAILAPPLTLSSRANAPFDETHHSGVLLGTAHWIPLISFVASESGVPWQVLRAVMTVESNGNPSAYSEATQGVGLMLVTPAIRERSSLAHLDDLLDPYENVRLTADYLVYARETWGSWDLAVASWYDVRHADVDLFSTGYTWDSAFYRYLQSYREALAQSAYQEEHVKPGARALLHALTAVGMPYRYGGHSMEHGGFDCSGLVYWAFNYVGANMPRPTYDQWAVSVRISESELQPGDLIFFANTWSSGISHVGIYAGNGMMLHAPREGKNIEFIPLSDSYWSAHLAGYGRFE
jgi:hypothetical protein